MSTRSRTHRTPHTPPARAGDLLGRNVWVAPYRVGGCPVLICVDDNGERVAEYVVRDLAQFDDVVDAAWAFLDTVPPAPNAERAAREDYLAARASVLRVL